MSTPGTTDLLALGGRSPLEAVGGPRRKRRHWRQALIATLRSVVARPPVPGGIATRSTRRDRGRSLTPSWSLEGSQLDYLGLIKGTDKAVVMVPGGIATASPARDSCRPRSRRHGPWRDRNPRSRTPDGPVGVASSRSLEGSQQLASQRPALLRALAVIVPGGIVGRQQCWPTAGKG